MLDALKAVRQMSNILDKYQYLMKASNDTKEAPRSGQDRRANKGAIYQLHCKYSKKSVRNRPRRRKCTFQTVRPNQRKR